MKYSVFSHSLNVFLISISCCFFYSCGNSIEKSGSIALYGNRIELYHENMVELKIPNSVTEKIFMIRWEIVPWDAAEVHYYRNELRDMQFKHDRKAVIIPAKSGSFLIRAYARKKSGEAEYLIAEKNVEVR